MRTLLIGCLLILVLATVSHAQWSDDPAVNLAVADAASDQVQAKVAPTPDGGCYISWFDNLGGGYDVRIQKLDAAGNELLAHNGVLVADRGFSSTQDYGLDVDASGNALLAFRDDRLGGIQISASKVSPTGTLLWGTMGVQLTSPGAFVASPKIAGTSDGNVVVTWTQDSDARLMKLDATGGQLWMADVVLTPPAGTYTASDLHDAGTDVILSIVHVIGPEFWQPKQLRAQKLDLTGAQLWGGGSPIDVFDTGSLQFGNYPDFVPDGSGGAVFSWYDTSSQLQCYAQRILANGSEAFPHNGSVASTNATRARVSPSASFNSSTNETFLFWREQNSSQSQHGVYGQKFDATGNRQWTDSGAVVVPVGSVENGLVRCLTEGTGAFVFWEEIPSFGQDRLYGARLNASGSIDIAKFDVASTPSTKMRLDVGRSTAGFAILAWNDDRAGDADIFAQNVNPDGSLGTSMVGVPEGGGDASALFLGAPRPNPTAGATWFEYSAAGSREIVFDIYDARGRVVRTGLTSPGGEQGIVTWDGLDRAGARVPSGVYLLRMRCGAETRTRKVTVIK